MAKSRSPSRSPGPPTAPLPPCLVHRSLPPSSPPLEPRRVFTRRPSLPLSLPSPVKLVTVPLRACCPDCIHITEECMREGDLWKEKFSRGARRRRSASLDTGPIVAVQVQNTPALSTSTSNPSLRSGFAAVACPNGKEALVSSSFPRAFSITVDEVDKRRKSQEFTDADVDRVYQESISRGDKRSPTKVSFPPKVSASPIEEEDEDQLFPLPSPRRSPNASPSPSVNSSPSPSPNASTSCLGAAALASASRDSLKSVDDVLGRSLTRKGRCEKGLLTPEIVDNALQPMANESSTRSKPPPINVPPPRTHIEANESSTSLRLSRSRSPSSPRKHHFALSVPHPSSAAFLRAGADVLKGVTSISGGPTLSV